MSVVALWLAIAAVAVLALGLLFAPTKQRETAMLSLVVLLAAALVLALGRG